MAQRTGKPLIKAATISILQMFLGYALIEAQEQPVPPSHMSKDGTLPVMTEFVTLSKVLILLWSPLPMKGQ